MNEIYIPGIGNVKNEDMMNFIEIKTGGDGLWKTGKEGVRKILTPIDKKVEFIVYEDKTLTYVKSAMGHSAIYPLLDAKVDDKIEAVLMDLDGTSVHSESFWIWIIERTIARLLNNHKFSLEESDIPHVSGNSVSEHLQYCINKYSPGRSLEDARKIYFDITEYEMKEIMESRGKTNAFTPAEDLKEFLVTLKSKDIKIGLVTSGLYKKAWPEILSAFKTMNMGDPLNFYDSIITAGQALGKGNSGTLGELTPKPHPWLYSETARVGLGIGQEKRHKVIGIEDSSAGVVSIRLAGFAAIGLDGGNIRASGVSPLLYKQSPSLSGILKWFNW